MKFIYFFSLSFVLFKPVFSETILTKSDILKESNKCLQYQQNHVCRKLILQMEQIQLGEFENNRLKCQSSILGLQTELVEAYFFKKVNKRSNGIMIPYVIKNC